MMTIDDVLRMIDRKVAEAGSARALAKRWGISAAYLSDIRSKKRAPGPSVLKHLNMVSHRIYSVHYAQKSFTKDKAQA